MKTFFPVVTLVLLIIHIQNQATAQDQLILGGDLELGANFFMSDEKRGAVNIPQYDNQLIGLEGWLNVVGSYKGFEAGLRYDLYNNSNLQNPNGSFSGSGIGRWFIRKSIGKLDIEAGYIYDQIGTGIIFRSYETRPLFIDNAIEGLRLQYTLNDKWSIRGFGGRMRNPLSINKDSDLPPTFGASIKGLAVDGFIQKDGSIFSMAPGFGIVNRTLTRRSVETLQNIGSTYIGEDRDQVDLKYNVYALTLYNRLSIGPFSWYVEGAYKTDSPIWDPFDEKTTATGGKSIGQYVNHSGHVLYTSLSYAQDRLGIVVEGKRTEHFSFRTDPTLALTEGLINFLPPVNRENTYRLTARYAPAVQDFGEQVLQADIRYRLSKSLSMNVNFSNITDVEDYALLYREFYTELLLKKPRKYRLTAGIQFVEYNQEIYEVKPGVPNVKTIVPFVEYLHQLNRKNSLRFEGQYMKSDEDYGSWIFALIEYGIAPKWIFTVSDMYNVDPKKTEKLHYPTAGIAYTERSNRFALSYVKQVEGVVCSGGVCRLEPAFSGFKFSVNSTF